MLIFRELDTKGPTPMVVGTSQSDPSSPVTILPDLICYRGFPHKIIPARSCPVKYEFDFTGPAQWNKKAISRGLPGLLWRAHTLIAWGRYWEIDWKEIPGNFFTV